MEKMFCQAQQNRLVQVYHRIFAPVPLNQLVFAPPGNSSDDVSLDSEPEGICPTEGEIMGGASRSPAPGGENKEEISLAQRIIAGTAVPPMRRAPGVTSHIIQLTDEEKGIISVGKDRERLS